MQDKAKVTLDTLLLIIHREIKVAQAGSQISPHGLKKVIKGWVFVHSERCDARKCEKFKQVKNHELVDQDDHDFYHLDDWAKVLV